MYMYYFIMQKRKDCQLNQPLTCSSAQICVRCPGHVRTAEAQRNASVMPPSLSPPGLAEPTHHDQLGPVQSQYTGTRSHRTVEEQLY